MMRKEYSVSRNWIAGGACSLLAVLGCTLWGCSTAPAPQANAAEPADAVEISKTAPAASAEAIPVAGEGVSPAASALPVNYRDIQFPEFTYVAPHPKDYRVEIAPGIVGYIASDRSLPLVNFTVYFEESSLPSTLKEEAASEMISSMLRRGAGGGISPHDLDDSLEFISAGITTSAGTFTSMFDIDCLSKDFKSMMELSRKVLTAPAFDSAQLEIVKAGFVTSYDRRYDTPAKVLSALRAKVNYAPNLRLWDATSEEYKAVTAADVKRLAAGTFSSKKIMFALSGDVDRDSSIAYLKEFFAGWKVEPAARTVKPEPLSFLRKPGVYVVDKDISQANITMNQPFVKRPHPDYYPAAVASFILGGGSFSSRLVNRVRSDEGLAYTVYSSVGNDYLDTSMSTIALQTKVETVDLALKLIFEEVDKLAKEGPTAEELEQAKKSLIESLPSLFDSPSSTAIIFAKGTLLGKSDDHYLDYVKDINAVTAEQVKAMTAKYFGKENMTISIVGPVSKFEPLKPFTVVPLDSLDMRD